MNLDFRFFRFSGFRFRLTLLNLWVIKWNLFWLCLMLRLWIFELRLLFFTVCKWDCSFNHNMVTDYCWWILHNRSFGLFFAFVVRLLIFWCLGFSKIGQSCLSFLGLFFFLLNSGWILFLFFLVIGLLLSSFFDSGFSLFSFLFVFVSLFVPFSSHLILYQST